MILLIEKKVVRGNNNLIIASNEIWCFGPIADGVMAEIRLAIDLGLKIRFFTIGKRIKDIKEISVEEIIFEDELLEQESRASLLLEIKEYLSK